MPFTPPPPIKKRPPSPAGPTGTAWTCPYCKVPLDFEPKRSRKCPSCKQQMVLTYAEDGARILTTEDHASALWKARSARQRVATPLQEFARFGFTETDIQALIDRGLNDRDIRWRLLQEATGRTEDLEELAGLDFSKAWQLFEEGRDHREVRRYSTYLKLKNYQRVLPSLLDTHVVQIMAIRAGCGPCLAQNGHAYTMEAALKHMPVPHPGCQMWADRNPHGGWCRCGIVLIDRKDVTGPIRSD